MTPEARNRVVELGRYISELKDDIEHLDVVLEEKRGELAIADAELDELLGAPRESTPVVDAEVEEPMPATASPEARDASKQHVAEELLQTEIAVKVTFDARREDVLVPPAFKGQGSLVLRFGYNLSPPLPDLIIDGEAIAATLTFGGKPHACRIPWRAVFAITNEAGQGIVWPDDVPKDLGNPTAAPAPAKAPETKPERHLKSIPMCCICEDDKRGERVVGPDGITWRKCRNCDSGPSTDVAEAVDEILANYVVHEGQHPDEVEDKDEDDDPFPPKGDCKWCRGTGNVRSSIDIRQGPCPCRYDDLRPGPGAA